jgi:hypothetical protein
MAWGGERVFVPVWDEKRGKEWWEYPIADIVVSDEESYKFVVIELVMRSDIWVN